MPAKKNELTETGSHIALQRGYAQGQIIERGESVPGGVPVSTEWMVPKAEAAAALVETEE